ncbi:hypothetical protein HN011_004880 [Eciton burchellii]|nr:hypothetical protein HN011_004880 [Eciton burchellii]
MIETVPSIKILLVNPMTTDHQRKARKEGSGISAWRDLRRSLRMIQGERFPKLVDTCWTIENVNRYRYPLIGPFIASVGRFHHTESFSYIEARDLASFGRSMQQPWKVPLHDEWLVDVTARYRGLVLTFILRASEPLIALGTAARDCCCNCRTKILFARSVPGYW